MSFSGEFSCVFDKIIFLHEKNERFFMRNQRFFKKTCKIVPIYNVKLTFFIFCMKMAFD